MWPVRGGASPQRCLHGLAKLFRALSRRRGPRPAHRPTTKVTNTTTQTSTKNLTRGRAACNSSLNCGHALCSAHRPRTRPRRKRGIGAFQAILAAVTGNRCTSTPATNEWHLPADCGNPRWTRTHSSTVIASAGHPAAAARTSRAMCAGGRGSRRITTPSSSRWSNTSTAASTHCPDARHTS